MASARLANLLAVAALGVCFHQDTRLEQLMQAIHLWELDLGQSIQECMYIPRRCPSHIRPERSQRPIIAPPLKSLFPLGCVFFHAPVLKNISYAIPNSASTVQSQ